MLKTKLRYLLLLGLTGLLTSCGEEGEASAKPSPQQMPKTAVDIELPVVKDLVVYNEFSGRTAASETVEVIPRVSGLLEKKHFTSGQYVKKGQLLRCWMLSDALQVFNGLSVKEGEAIGKPLSATFPQ